MARHPWWTIGGWLVAAVLIVLLAPPLPTQPNQSHELSDDYQSVQVDRLQEHAFPGRQEAYTGVYVILRHPGGGSVTDADVVKAGQVGDALRGKKIVSVTGVDPQTTAPDRSLVWVPVRMIRSTVASVLVQQADAVTQIRAALPELLAGSDLQAKVGGDAAAYLDDSNSLSQSLSIVTIATLVLIIGLILLIFRGPLAAVLPIIVIPVTMEVALSIAAMVATPANLVFDQSLQIVVLILMFGIGADYFLFLLWRFRERLRAGDDRATALRYAVERAGRVIIGTALTTMGAVLVLLLASFRLFQAWGPALAIAVGTMAVTALTLIPALLRLLGPAIFWPSKGWQRQPKGRTAARLGQLVARRPAVVAVVSVALMAVLGAGVFTFKLSYDVQGGFPTDTESYQAQQQFEKVVPGAAGLNYPAEVMLRSKDGSRLGPEQLTAFVAAVQHLPGVGVVEPPSVGTADPSVAQVDIRLQQDPFSDDAIVHMRDTLRPAILAAAPAGTNVYVGGITSGYVDIDHATRRDLPVILVAAAVLIALILALVVRSLVAPLLLVPSVLLGFAAALGAAVYVFQDALDKPGLNFQLPLLLYLFVLAIGTDYNILMVSRLREEISMGHGPREAAGRAIQHAAPIAAAAGLILAGTFSVMLLAPVTMMRQLGFSVALGIAISAFVMAPFLVPALTVLVGRGFLWPSKAARQQDGRHTDRLSMAER
ncbi:MMPL family transporter [Kutzneria buriramensis]|uniref:MMPL family transporter n=1 Tax=Kutzneria buriramensis TaxID=1045776 RepID=UPI001B86BE7A|nr:MMPL family transporter [Kutzneria buriramensis]